MHAICQTSAPLDFACVPQLQQCQPDFQSVPALQSSFQEQAPTQYASWQTSVLQSQPNALHQQLSGPRCLFQQKQAQESFQQVQQQPPASQAGLNPTMSAEQFENFQSQSALQFHHTVCY